VLLAAEVAAARKCLAGGIGAKQLLLLLQHSIRLFRGGH
jgi:hypothetical protein